MRAVFFRSRNSGGTYGHEKKPFAAGNSPLRRAAYGIRNWDCRSQFPVAATYDLRKKARRFAAGLSQHALRNSYSRATAMNPVQSPELLRSSLQALGASAGNSYWSTASDNGAASIRALLNARSSRGRRGFIQVLPTTNLREREPHKKPYRFLALLRGHSSRVLRKRPHRRSRSEPSGEATQHGVRLY